DNTVTGRPTFSPLAGNRSAPTSSARGTGDTITFDWHDESIRFRLTAARRTAAAVDVTQLGNADVRNAIQAMGDDAPNTQFRLDLLFEFATVTFPRLIGAKVQGAFLTPDPENPTVKLHLPRLLMHLTQDSAADT